METTVATTTVTPATGTDVSLTNKADCYFYYYSSCNKGNACPYRHEPAALMNETMCVYWLKGNCSKPHCIYRHMEITKKRDKIPCFFESQPGGCKKLHCPFLHNNVLDRPREEDVPNNPDLILPVKDSEAEYETEQSEAKRLQESVAAQLKLQRKLSQTQNPNFLLKEMENSPESPAPCITRKSFIVPLQDGESDSESVCVSPAKTTQTKRRCVVSEAERDWELERLREIQKEEGNLLGYSFTSEEEQKDTRDQYSNPPSLISPSNSYEEVEEFVDDEDHDETSHTIIRRNFPRPQKTLVVGEEGGYVKRVLGGTLKKRAKCDAILKNVSQPSVLNNGAEDHVVVFNRSSLNDGLQTALSERLGPKNNSSKLSVKERLGKKKMKESENDVENKPRSVVTNKQEDFVKNRHWSKEEGVKSRLTLKEDRVKSRLTVKEDKEQMPDRKANFIIKSLADIRAEKERQKHGNQLRSVAKTTESLPLSTLVNKKKGALEEEAADIVNIKVKTLAEIKAEKGKGTLSEPKQTVAFGQFKPAKRSISPIRFDCSPTKKTKSSVTRASETIEIESNEPSLKFSPRKLTLKRPTGGAGNKESREHNSSTNVLVSKVSSDSSSKSTFDNNSSPEPTQSKNSSTELLLPSNDISSETEASQTEKNKSDKKRIKTNNNASSYSVNKSIVNLSNLDNSKGSDQTNTSTSKSNVSRLDSFIDEDKLLLEEDMNQFDDDEIDEDELLL